MKRAVIGFFVVFSVGLQGCAKWYLFEFRDSGTLDPLVGAHVALGEPTLIPFAVNDWGNTDYEGRVVLKSAPLSVLRIKSETHGFQSAWLEVREMSETIGWFPVIYTGEDDVSADIETEWIECRLTQLRTRFGVPQLP